MLLFGISVLVRLLGFCAVLPSSCFAKVKRIKINVVSLFLQPPFCLSKQGLFVQSPAVGHPCRAGCAVSSSELLSAVITSEGAEAERSFRCRRGRAGAAMYGRLWFTPHARERPPGKSGQTMGFCSIVLHSDPV